MGVFGFDSVARLPRQCGGSSVGTDSAESGVPVIYFPRPPPLLLGSPAGCSLLVSFTKGYVLGFPVAQTMIKDIVCFTPTSPAHLPAWHGFTLNGLSGGCASATAAGTWVSGTL